MTLEQAAVPAEGQAARSVSQASDAPLAFRQCPWVAPLMMLTDVAVLELCVWLSYLVRQTLLVHWFPIQLSPVNYLGVAAGVLVLPGVYFLMELYPGYGTDGPERLRRRVVSTTVIFATLIGWDYLVQGGLWSRGVLLGTWGFATVLLPVVTGLLIGGLVRAGLWGTPVLIVGPPDEARAMIENLQTFRKVGLVPVGIVSDVAAPPDGAVRGVPYLGAVATASRFSGRVRTVLVVDSGRLSADAAEMMASLPFPHVILVPNFSGVQSLWVTARDLGGTTGLEIKQNLLIRHNRVVKRVLDLVLASVILLFGLPLLLFLCLAIITISPGSPFYAQVREGEGGRRFRMMKLRTMYKDAELRLAAHLGDHPEAAAEWRRHFKLRDDPRVLPVLGVLLRRSSLDELPQLINVLRGEMSLVGPRPFPHYHLESFNPAFRELRRKVRPGLTGLWQVEVRADGALDLQEAYDTYYIRNWSLWLDIYILARTFGAVLNGQGAR